jgi:small subunit ribosomal protein S14
MAKKSRIAKDTKRRLLIERLRFKRQVFKQSALNADTFDEKLDCHAKLQKLPRDSSRSRYKNRCLITGRSRGFYRSFGLSRHNMREMAHQGLLPGVIKSSW